MFLWLQAYDFPNISYRWLQVIFSFLNFAFWCELRNYIAWPRIIYFSFACKAWRGLETETVQFTSEVIAKTGMYTHVRAEEINS